MILTFATNKPNIHQHTITMKKTFLILAALLMMGSVAFAGGGFDFSIGPKIGYQTSKLSYKGADIKNEFSNHFTVGIFGRVTIGRLYVQPELLYFKASNIFNVDFTGTNSDNLFNIPSGADVSITLNQMNLQVPVMVGVNIIDIGVFTLRVQAGPTANFLLGSKTLVDYKINGNSEPQQAANNDQKFDPKKISWGMQAGLGIDVLKRLTLDINYNFGLSKVFDNLNNTALGQTFDFSNIDNTKLNTFMVTVGVKFF